MTSGEGSASAADDDDFSSVGNGSVEENLPDRMAGKISFQLGCHGAGHLVREIVDPEVPATALLDFGWQLRLHEVDDGPGFSGKTVEIISRQGKPPWGGC